MLSVENVSMTFPQTSILIAPNSIIACFVLSSPSVSTSNPTMYTAIKENVTGVLISKDNQWFFEYYQDEKLISEKINVKF